MNLFKTRFLTLATAAFALLLAAPRVVAQAPATTASIHGHVTNAAGFPFASADVKFSTDKTGDPKGFKFPYTFTTDANGDYKGTGIAPGDYSAFVTQGDKFIDRLEVKVVAGEDKTLDFDMTRADYQKNMTPEEKKALEEYKKNAGAAMEANKVIGNLNATLAAVRTDLKSATPNYDKDVADMKAVTTSKPEEGILWMTYGEALSASAGALAKTDKASGKPPMSDDQVLSQYQAATDAFKKGIDLNAASKKPSPADQAVAYNSMGNAFANEGKVTEAQASFDAAVKLDPTKAGMFYYNEAAVLFNASQTNSALAGPAVDAANKAITADPSKPEPYYIKGQILLQKATMDPKTNKLQAPPGCVEAYQKYLEIAPDGKYAAGVKEILTALGEKIETHYKAGKK